MIIVLSFVLAYVLCGLAHVTDNLGAEPLKKPSWTFQPTLGKMLFAGVTWPIADIVKENYGNPGKEISSIAAAAFSSIVHFTILTVWIWCCIIFSAYLFDNTILQIVSVVVLLLIGGKLILPWAMLFLMPVLMLAAAPIFIPIGLISLRRERRENQQIPWCKNCKHYRKSKRYENIAGGSWTAESMLPIGELPCAIAEDASDVWENHFNLDRKSRTLYPKNCEFFEARKERR